MLLDILKKIVTKDLFYEEDMDRVLKEVVSELESTGKFSREGVRREVLENLNLDCKVFCHDEEEVDCATRTLLIQVSPVMLLEATRSMGPYSDENWDATLRLAFYNGRTREKRLEQERNRIRRALEQLHKEELELQQLQD
jgi:hypothetical protein